MKNRVLTLAALIGAAGCGSLFATTYLRTPLNMMRDFGSIHDRQVLPLPESIEEGCWKFEQYNGLYSRTADKAFAPKNGTTRKTVSLAELFFGQESFTVGNTFPGGCGVIPNNPFASIAQISPSFHYNEKGLISTLRVERKFDCSCWRVGMRAAIPFVMNEIERDLNCQFEETDLSEVARTLQEQVDKNTPGSSVRTVYIYRMDFLTALRALGLPATSLVDYTAPVTVAGVDVTNGTLAPTPRQSIIRSTDGTISGIASSISLATGESDIARDVGVLPTLNANGTGGGNGERLTFAAATDYSSLGADCAAQRQLFIIPNSNGNGVLRATNDQLRQEVQYILNSLIPGFPTTPSAFLLSKGINLCDNRRVNGVGDLDTDFYVGYDYSDCLYTELIMGIHWPTGKRMKNAGEVYFTPTGNNGHYELKAQIDVGWNPYDWFALHIDASYSHVFKRTEKKAAAFKGATVINVGTSVDADVSWGYGVLDVDFNFLHPDSCGLGLVLSYQLYAKRKDKVNFDKTTALDLNGVAQMLDASLLEKHTNALSNKLRAEMFHRWDYGEIFIGASRVIAGRSVFKETEAYIGMGLLF